MIENRQLKELVLPILILFLSLQNLLEYITLTNLFGLLITIIGLIGVVMFFLKKGNPNLFFRIWVFSQFPAIYTENYVINNGVKYITEETHIFNIKQFFSFKISWELGLFNNTILYIGLYLIPFLYLGLYKMTVASHFINKKVEFNPIKNDTQFQNEFPINGTILKRVEFNKENDWLLVECDEEIRIENIKTKNILIKPKDEKTFKRKKGIISYLRVSKEDTKIPNIIKHKEDYPFYEWVSIKVK